MIVVRVLAGCVVAVLTLWAVVATLGALWSLVREPSLAQAAYAGLLGYASVLLVLGWWRRILVVLGRAPDPAGPG